jgi:AraC family transcriptional regulator
MDKLFIKNMVCPRCIASVENILNKIKIPFRKVVLGEVTLDKQVSEGLLNRLEVELKAAGFELINNRMSVIIEKIKKAVIEYVGLLNEEKRINLSVFIAGKVNYEYTYLSNLFSSIEGITIEHFFIQQRVEKVKELIVYDKHSLSEIADNMGYSSVHHLSSQFKKVTGLTPSHFKKIGQSKRKFIDNL